MDVLVGPNLIFQLLLSAQIRIPYIFDSLLLSFPQIEIGTLAPPDYSYPVPEASLEEQEEEEEEEAELPLKPQLIPQGSGGSGVLMGPDTQKGLKNHIHLGLHTHKHHVTSYPSSLCLRGGPALLGAYGFVGAALPIINKTKQH